MATQTRSEKDSSGKLLDMDICLIVGPGGSVRSSTLHAFWLKPT